MNHYKCDIIKDLIPSYLDGICSEASRCTVEEHLTKCDECRSFLERIRDTELMVDETNLETFDYMKKVKRHYLRKNTIAACICLLFGLFLLFLPEYSGLLPQLQYGLYYALFPLLMLTTAFLLSNACARPTIGRMQKIAAAGGVFGILYCMLLESLCIYFPKIEHMFFFSHSERIGPILDMQLKAIIIMELVFFALLVFDGVRSDHTLGLLPLLNLTGCFLCLIFSCQLHRLNTLETAAGLIVRSTLTVLCESLVIAGVILLCARLSNYHKKRSEG